MTTFPFALPPTNTSLLRVSPLVHHHQQQQQNQIYSNLFGHNLNSPNSALPDHVKTWSPSSPMNGTITSQQNQHQTSYSNNSMQSSSSPSSSIASSSSSSSSSNMIHNQSPISPTNQLNQMMQLQQQQQQPQAQMAMGDSQLSALHFHLQREQTLNMFRNGARFFDPRYSLPRKFF